MNTRALVKEVQKRVDEDGRGHYPGTSLIDWFADAKDELLWRINVFAIAGELGVDRDKLLATFIKLVAEGVLDLNWDFHCTECNAVAGSHRHLSEATSGNHCPLCNVDFRNDLAHNVEVTFTPSAKLYAVSQKFLDEQTKAIVQKHKEKKIRLPHTYVSGMDCLHVPLFREMFETETLSVRESLSISQVCIMFTDIKGSTELYERLGDSAAYGLVRDHFDILFRSVEQNGGVIVKTIGDSVMASFRRPADGVAAAIAIQSAFEQFNKRENLRNEIIVKIGLHSGSTIMVNLNNRLDYFGQVVNMAARIQGTADGGDIIISKEIRRDHNAIQRMRGHVKALTRRPRSLKGISGTQETFRLEFSPVEQPAQAALVT
ncbi:MAG TPA: adenylate/guanylate cyclase domain-containing protein [Spirochaetia bacterium]|nr:adenylate/guanylate cyclase domain-containing protein [Spirochaetia bacterium]